jgi:hypothetical protein
MMKITSREAAWFDLIKGMPGKMPQIITEEI